MNFIKKNPCSIPLLFLLAYGIPIIIWISNYTEKLDFWIRGIAIIAFVSIFTQIMLGTFRKFFNDHYKARNIFKLHNYLGFSTLILALIHGLYKAWQAGWGRTLFFNLSLPVNLGIIGLYIMLIAVPVSNLKFIYKVNINNKVWRIIHLANYTLFPLIYAHAMIIGSDFATSLMQYLSMTFLGITLIALGYRVHKVIKK